MTIKFHIEIKYFFIIKFNKSTGYNKTVNTQKIFLKLVGKIYIKK